MQGLRAFMPEWDNIHSSSLEMNEIFLQRSHISLADEGTFAS